MERVIECALNDEKKRFSPDSQGLLERPAMGGGPLMWAKRGQSAENEA